MNKHGGCDAEVVHQSPSNAASDPYSMRDINTSAWRSSSSTEEEKASCRWPQGAASPQYEGNSWDAILQDCGRASGRST